ncbi:MAG TPA: SemiSWEET family transporter [Terriglobales bacterium]|nr:SemiSWEET family transporter [Terriglobales bacterium]
MNRKKRSRFPGFSLGVLLPTVILLGAWRKATPETQDLLPRDTRSLLFSQFMRSEILGLVAGFGTTFAALPDLIAMLRRRSSAGMNPRMAAIMGVFQVLWVYYGLLISSRPVIIWNVIAVVVNFISVGAYFFFRRREKQSNDQSNFPCVTEGSASATRG